MILTSLIIAAIVHEFGHWIVAKLFGYSIKFRFDVGHLWFIPIPRGIWDMPITSRKKQRIIALAGFGFEFLISILLYFVSLKFTQIYLGVASLHLIVYRFYAGESSDFNFI